METSCYGREQAEAVVAEQSSRREPSIRTEEAVNATLVLPPESQTVLRAGNPVKIGLRGVPTCVAGWESLGRVFATGRSLDGNSREGDANRLVHLGRCRHAHDAQID